MDHRDRAAAMPRRLTASPNGRTVFFELDEERFSLPGKFHVCSTCEGTGRHVNPSVDSHGITAEEMDELGPGFEEDYFSGVHDVTCYGCKGSRVVIDVDRERVFLVEDKALLERLDEQTRDDESFLAEQEAERRMGA